jgi:Tfp pilus assembly protein PilF
MAARLLKDVLVSRKDWAGMARLASRVLEAGPSAEWSRIKAQGYFNQADYKACRRVLDAALMDFPKDAQLVLLDANTLKKEGKVAASQARFQAAKAMYIEVGTP